MTAPFALSPRHKRLLYRATHRGTKEADAVVGGYVTRHLSSFSSLELDHWEQLMELSDSELMEQVEPLGHVTGTPGEISG